MATLLLEINAEEIPAGYIQPALDGLAHDLLSALAKARINHGPHRLFGTPRRLAIEIKDVADRQQPLKTEVVGPPRSVGFDTNGKATVAAEKFAQKVGLPLAKLKVKSTDKGEYLCGTKTERGLATSSVLKTVLPQAIKAIQFPKTMRWADLSLSFARPIHSIVALLGAKIVSFQMENLKSGRYSFGHPFMNPGKVKLTDADSYVATLEAVNVFVDLAKRRQMVIDEVNRAAASVSGEILPDEELIDIVTNLVEYPVAVIGRFEEEFLEVPDEVLITAMREHQKYFAIIDADKKLMPCFVAVNNTRTRDMQLVAEGHGKVIRARLKDAQFFYQADCKVLFDPWIERLNGVLFQAQLGTMHAKVDRVQQLAADIAAASGCDDGATRDAVQAARLCKADLVSQVVVEFPKLQGVMGRVYAKVAGENDAVAMAVEEHYRPTRSGGALPQSLTGAIVSIADKIDSICGCFCVGLVPTGAADPYALRRQGIGILQIILERRLDLALRPLIARSLQLYKDKASQSLAETEDQILAFLINRLSHMLVEQGLSKDVIAAVLVGEDDRILRLLQRVQALEKLKREPDFEPLATGFKRVVNIIKKSTLPSQQQIDSGLFEDESETALLKAFNAAESEVDRHIEASEFERALLAIAAMRPAVDAFFDGVLVNCDDVQVRNNRLNLLRKISTLFSRLADFSKITT
jgi:glycyl-tRNA synthetase beta chain